MSIALSLLFLFCLSTLVRRSLCSSFSRQQNLFTFLLCFQLVAMWGTWNSVASYRLEKQNDGHDDFGSTEESTALEACTAMSYLYGLLPVVLIDVVLPSRYVYMF